MVSCILLSSCCVLLALCCFVALFALCLFILACCPSLRLFASLLALFVCLSAISSVLLACLCLCSGLSCCSRYLISCVMLRSFSVPGLADFAWFGLRLICSLRNAPSCQGGGGQAEGLTMVSKFEASTWFAFWLQYGYVCFFLGGGFPFWGCLKH